MNLAIFSLFTYGTCNLAKFVGGSRASSSPSSLEKSTVGGILPRNFGRMIAAQS
jgi:hypothetical protein